MIGIIKRYIDIALYTVISWLLISYIGQSEFAKKTIDGWRKFNDSLPYPIDYIPYLIAGLLTKHILVNCGDYNIHHELHNEKRFIVKSEQELTDLGLFNIKSRVYLFIVNPPLRLSIIFFGGLIIATSNPAINGSYLKPILFYFLGVLIPQTIKSIFSSLPQIVSLIEDKKEQNQEKSYQYERPIRYLNEDYLGRTALVERLHNIITSNKITDARGIAIVGGYGIGKTSIINMALNQVMLSSHNFVTCHITTWGNYTSEENIQKIIIEQIISEVTKVTSTTSLSGLPSKYINSLKGAQSLWLDALPLLDCHSSANSQLDKLNELLSRINYKVILVIEDIDRNDEKNKILNSIASLIDKLNSYSSFRLILSIGEELYLPEIINRVCRYKEHLAFDDASKVSTVESCIKKLLSQSNIKYRSSETLFNEKNESEFGKFIVFLLSYITNLRDLKAILRELEYDWDNILIGNCDIVDLLTITILKQFEPALIKLILTEDLNYGTSSAIKEISKIEAIKNKDASEAIINYLFGAGVMKNTSARLQSCIFAPSRYIPTLIERKLPTKKGYIVCQDFFTVAENINKLSASAYSKRNAIELAKMLFKARRLSPPGYLYDSWGYIFKDNAFIITLYQLQYGLLTKKVGRNRSLNPKEQASDHIKKSGTSTDKPETCNKIIKCIVQHLISEEDIFTLNSIYNEILNPIENYLVYRPETFEIIALFEKIYNAKKISNHDELYKVIQNAIFTLYQACYSNDGNKYKFVEPFKKIKSEFITELLDTIKRYSEIYEAGKFNSQEHMIAFLLKKELDQDCYERTDITAK
ncbi:hypothetical protein JD501_00320 [Aeromonas hydrophila]|uniref:P-loop NTPase fold protein n=1 Tax=Aeromonas hydrophila TaxID=644 RepID=UPI00191D32D3|nr:P-loop NTPase fold protein [Aeromonas hydrophila]MBL0431680.1 hypothetical protein [Aeromonas hydrophila]MBL0467651.1 hypothetical protein [Aeromonas hydrophila]